ncbi:MAG: hypothetical protein ACTSRZ_10905 [Promethearchaeota archaeon]
MTLLDAVSNVIENVTPKYAFITDNGIIVKSTIGEENLLKIVKLLPNLLEELDHGCYIHAGKIYIYMLTQHFIIVLLTDLEENIIEGLFYELDERYSIKIKKEYSELPKTLKSIVKYIVFSMARSMGPAPLYWIPQSLNEKDAFKIAMKSLLILSGEINGANRKKMLAFQPLPEMDGLNICYIFQIPFNNARGGFFDSSISVICAYEDRAVVYQNYSNIENILSKGANRLTKTFISNANETGEFINEKIFDNILKEILDDFDSIPLNITKSAIVKDEMMRSLQELKEI